MRRAVSSQLNVAARTVPAARSRPAARRRRAGARSPPRSPRVVRVDEQRGITGRLGQGRDVRRQDGRAAGHRLEDGQPEPLVQRRVHQRLRAARATPPSPTPRRSRSRRRARGPAEAARRAPDARGPNPPGSMERPDRPGRAGGRTSSGRDTNARISAGRFLRGSIPPSDSRYGPSIAYRRRTASTAFASAPAGRTRCPRRAGTTGDAVRVRRGYGSRRSRRVCSETDDDLRRATRAPRPAGRAIGAVASGAVCGNNLNARSWTVSTSRRLRVGGGTKFGANSTSKRHHPLEPRDVETERDAVEPPRRDRHAPVDEVRRRDVLERVGVAGPGRARHGRRGTRR